MKSQFLKIAGVKSEKAFYKKYPTEAAFFKAHPEAKKMANGGEQDKGQIQKLQQLTDFGNPPMAQFGKSTPFDPSNPFGTYQNLPYDPNFKVGKLETTSPTSLGGQPTGFGQYVAGMGQSKRAVANNYSQMFGNSQTKQDLSTGIANPLAGYQSTKMKAPKETFLKKNVLSKAGAIGKSVGKIIDVLDQQKQAKQIAKQDRAITDVFSKAAMSSPVDIEKRQYIRPEDYIYQPEQMFPSYGVGTNVLAQDGAMIGGNPTEIMNTFAPNTIYSDMGYEPLNDSDRLKAYYHGGKMSKAQDGGMFSDIGDFFKGGEDSKFAEFMNQGGGEALTNLTSQVGSGGYGPTGGNVIGGEVGELAGSLLPIPGGKFIGKALGSTIGGLFDKSGKQIMANRQATNQNVSDIMYSKAGVGLQNQYQSYMEDGGYVSHDWTPQVIATFGEYKLKDLLQPPNDADMLRAGGHLRSYTPPSERAMYTGREQFAMGGDLQVDRGKIEPISTNPYLPEGGETIMFRGPSHDKGGMPTRFGKSRVEVEGGEPAVKLQDGTSGDSSLVVYGNLVNPKTGKKFKKDAEEISKNEAKQNKKIDKASTGLDNLDVNSSFDKLGLDTYNAIITGANMKLKQYAEDKMDLAALQSAINDTAEEYGLIADDLAKGKVKSDTSKDATAKYGTSLPKAQDGIIAKKFAAAKAEAEAALKALYPGKKVEIKYGSEDRPIAGGGNKPSQRGLKGSGASKTDVSIHNIGGAKDFLIYVDGKVVNDASVYKKTLHPAAQKQGLFTIGDWDPGHVTIVKEGVGNPFATAIQQYPELKNSKVYKDTIAFLEKQVNSKQASAGELRAYSQLTGKSVKGTPAYTPDYAGIAKQENAPAEEWQDIPPFEVPPPRFLTTSTTTTVVGATPPKLTPPYEGIINTLLPYLRPSDAEALDKQQLIPEMYAMISNDLESVYAQKYNPRLISPQDYSFQDRLNETTAAFENAKRQSAGDPSALAAIAAQESQIKSGILGEQFRTNQAGRTSVYNQNINTMNDADLRNIDILDRQYVRQSQAKSNTKATTQAALNSITDKYAKNKLDNRTLATYENLYNYRYDPSFRAQNMNPLAKFNTPTVTTNIPIYDNNGNIVGYQRPDGSAPAPATPPYVAPGSRKTEEKPKSQVVRNGSIVKALKNL
jgi:hypothetical protein